MTDPRAAQPIAPPKPAEPTAEYVTGGASLWSNRMAQSLPFAFDDVTADFGDDVYERMLFDPQVRASVNVLRTTVVADGLQLSSAIDDDAADGYDQAQEIRAFCESAIVDMATPIDDVIWDMLAALAFGSRIAEEVYRHEGSYLTLHALKVKPRRACAFVVDAYQNVLGILGMLPGQGWGMPGTTTIGDLAAAPNVLPREKFAVLTFRPESGDPRGTSLLRAAYSFWWLKQQIPGEYLKYLATYATPSLIGKVKEGKAVLANGTTTTRSQALLDSLLALKNNSALVIGQEDEVAPLAVPSEGARLFPEAFDVCDRQITTAILGATLATMEGQHQARAAAQEHGTVLDEAIGQIKRGVCGMLRRDVLRPLIAVNFGDMAARVLTPRCALGSADVPDLSALMDGIASLASANYLDVSQYPGVDQMLGLPARAVTDDPDARTGPGEDDG